MITSTSYPHYLKSPTHDDYLDPLSSYLKQGSLSSFTLAYWVCLEIFVTFLRFGFNLKVLRKGFLWFLVVITCSPNKMPNVNNFDEFKSLERIVATASKLSNVFKVYLFNLLLYFNQIHIVRVFLATNFFSNTCKYNILKHKSVYFYHYFAWFNNTTLFMDELSS